MRPRKCHLQFLHAHGHVTKTATVQVLLDLQKAGTLDGDDDAPTLKRKMQDAATRSIKAIKDVTRHVICAEISFAGYSQGFFQKSSHVGLAYK